MKWIHWTIVIIVILGLLNEVSTVSRKQKNRNLINIKRRAILRRKQLEALYADSDNDQNDDEDDYYDSFNLGRSAPAKSEVKEEEVPTNTGTEATAAAAAVGPEKDTAEGADSERLIGTGNNVVFSSFLTKKQNLLNKFTTSTSTSTTTVAPLTTTSIVTVTGSPAIISPTTGAAPTPAPAPAADFIGSQPVQRVQGQRVPGTGNRQQIVIQYRPVIRQTQRRRPGAPNYRRPVHAQNFNGFNGGFSGGNNVIRIPVRVQGG